MRCKRHLSNSSGITVWEVLIILGVIGFLAVILWPCGCSRARARRARCLSNIKQISIGILMYQDDYKDCYPDFKNWNEAVYPYTKSDRLLICPVTQREKSVKVPTYAINVNLRDKKGSDIPKPGETLLIFDSVPGRNMAGDARLLPAEPRHNGGSNIGFADGHAKWYKTNGRELGRSGQGRFVPKWKP